MLTVLAQQSNPQSGAEPVDFSGAWESVWSGVEGANSALLTNVGYVGLAILVGALFMWLWGKNQGQGRPLSTLWPALAIGAILSAPGFVVPAILQLVDLVVNLALNLLSGMGT